MDFIKNNLFYIILVVVVLAISVPSYVLASRQMSMNTAAVAKGTQEWKRVDGQLKGLKNVTDEAMAASEKFKAAAAADLRKCLEDMKVANRHLDEDFLIPTEIRGEFGPIPKKELYKPAYNAKYAELGMELVKAGLVASPRNWVLPPRVDFGQAMPDEVDIRASQKQYWMVKEVVSLLADPECGIKSVTKVALDYAPPSKNPDAKNHADETKAFWIYPMNIDVQMDFRYFPVLLEKMVNDKNLMIYPIAYKVQRTVDETQPVFVPTVAVSLSCEIREYISSPYMMKMAGVTPPPDAVGPAESAGASAAPASPAASFEDEGGR